MKLESMKFSPGGKNRKWITWGILFAFWVFGLGLVGWLMWESRNEIIELFRHGDYSKLLGAFLFYLGALVAVIVGWVEIMQGFAPKINWWKHVQIYCATLAARRLPGTLWYVGGRVVLYKKLGVSGTAMSIASSIELVISVVTGGLIGLILIPLRYELPIHILILLWGIVIIGFVLVQPKILKSISKRINDIGINIQIKNLVIWLVSYTFMWVMGGWMLVQIINVFQVVHSGDLVLIIGAWALSGAAGILTLFLPSSFGMTEVALTILLSQILPLPLAGTVSIITRLLSIFFEFLVAIIFFPIVRRSLNV